MSTKIQSKQTKIDLIKNASGDRVITPAMVSAPLTELNEDKLEKDLSNLPENSKTKIKEIANEDKAPELFKQSSENKEQALSDTKYTYGGLGINTKDVTASLNVQPNIDGTPDTYTLNFIGSEVQGYNVVGGDMDNISSYSHVILSDGTRHSFRVEEKQRRALVGTSSTTIKVVIIDDIEDPEGTNRQLEGVRFINDDSQDYANEPLAVFGDTTIMWDGSIKLSEAGVMAAEPEQETFTGVVLDSERKLKSLSKEEFKKALIGEETTTVSPVEQQVDGAELRDYLKIKWIYSKNNLIMNLVFENLNSSNIRTMMGRELSLGNITPDLSSKLTLNKELNIMTNIGKFRISVDKSLYITLSGMLSGNDFIITENIIL